MITAEGAYDAALATWRETGCHAEPAGDCGQCALYWAACDAFIAAKSASAGPGDVQPIGREALCADCGQSFNPCDDADLIHLVTTVPPGLKWGPDYTGDLPEGPERYCGGRGEHSGYWM